MKIFEKVKLHEEEEIKIVNIPIFHYGKRFFADYEENYFKILPSQSFEKKFLSKIINSFDDKYDFAILVRANGIGEIYLLSMLIYEIIENNRAKKPCIVVHRNVLKEVCKLYMPDIPVILPDGVYRNDFNVCLNSGKYKYHGIQFQVFNMPLNNAVELALSFKNFSAKYNYSDAVRVYQNCKTLNYREPYFTDEDKDIINTVEGLNIEKFVFINAEANYIKSLPNAFWEHLLDRFKKQGYDVYFNTSNIPISQALYLAKHSKMIVSMRAGFCELLSTLDIPQHIIYTKDIYNDTPCQCTINAYSLKNYPNVNKEKIYEYNLDDMNLSTLEENIIGSL